MKKADEIVPVRVLRAAGAMQIDAAVQQATALAAVGQCVVVAGIVYIKSHSPSHPRVWQFRLSHWGQPPIVVSIHRLRRGAEAQMARVQLLSRKRDPRDAAAFAALVTTLAAFGDEGLG